ncbi:MAG: hypothetical protein ACD_58C00257G0002 [uncultured bacterium]|nr:MAG: hypothetical protein ACD_58C00257G0002 [uncultured bacterium]
MKKNILYIISILVITSLAAAGYWYWRSHKTTETTVDEFQTVALDNPDIDSFDDVCTNKTDYELTCTGNIEQFSCNSFNSSDVFFANLQPSYPMIICKKMVQSKDFSKSNFGVYVVEGDGLLAGKTILTDYIFINNGTFQLIESENQFRQLFQPIESVAEAAAYFQALHKAALVLDESTLNSLKNSAAGQYLISPEEITLNSVNETVDGFTISAYSEETLSCKNELYSYTFILNRDGGIIEKSKTLIWRSELECTS